MSRWLITLSQAGGARQAGKHIINAFKSLIQPENVIVFDCKKYFSAFNILLKQPDETMAVDLMNQSLIVQCIQYDITHILVTALSPITLFTLNLLKKQNIKRIHWFIEDYKRADYWKEIIQGYSWFLAIQKNPFRKACEKNNCRFVYMPTATNEESLKTSQNVSNENKKYDIAFIGIPSVYRVKMLEYLASQNVSLAIAGEGWDRYKGPLSDCIISDKWVDFFKSRRMINSARIALNISYNEPPEDLSDVHLSPRVFDILSSDTPLLTEDVPLLHETLEGCYYQTFKSAKEAVEKIKAIIDISGTETEKEKLQTNRNILLQKHTWKKRAEQIIKLC